MIPDTRTADGDDVVVVAPALAEDEPVVVRRESRWFARPVAVAFVVAATRVAAGLLLARAALSVTAERGIGPPNGAGPKSLIWSFTHWDALAFLQIARQGYGRDLARTPFLPLYPLVGRVFADVTTLPVGPSLVLVSWISLFFATWALMELARALWPQSSWYRAGVIFAWMPTSIFLMAGYSEAIFAALISWAFVFLVRGRYAACIGFAALASAARPEGAVLGIVLVGVALYQRRPARAAVTALVSELGIVVVSLFYTLRFDRLLPQLHAETLWNRHPTWPFHPLFWSLTSIVRGRPVGAAGIESNTVAVFLMDDALVVAAVAAIVWLIVHARRDTRLVPLAAYAAACLLLIVSNGPFGRSPEASGRMLLCIAPLYVVPVRLRSERVWTALLVTSVVGAVCGALLFNLNFWFT